MGMNMAPRTITVYWRNARSGWFNYNWNGPINADSIVHISACEWVGEPGFVGLPPGVKYQGDATITVKNVRPHGPNPGDSISGGVSCYLQIDWGSPLNVVTDITVFEPAEQFDIVDAG